MHLLPHTDFDGAFTPGTVFLHGEDEWTMETVKWGTLVTPTGRLVACDALGPGRVKPFKRTVEPGKYPVDLAWNGSETCALRVRFSRRNTVHYEPALRVGERPSKNAEAHPPCFGIDSGIAGVFDSKAARIAGKDKEWSSRLDEGGDHALELDPKSGAGMVWCYSGYGDGGYPSFWGLDRSGEVAALVLDFLVLVEGVYDKHVVTNLPDKVGTELDDPWFKECGCTAVRLTWSKGKGELRIEYRRAESLDITLLNGRGKPIHQGGSGGGGGSIGDSNCPRYDFRKVDLRKENRAKLVFRKFTGFRSLERG
jgi:hypothetical protein